MTLLNTKTESLLRLLEHIQLFSRYYTALSQDTVHVPALSYDACNEALNTYFDTVIAIGQDDTITLLSSVYYISHKLENRENVKLVKRHLSICFVSALKTIHKTILFGGA